MAMTLGAIDSYSAIPYALPSGSDQGRMPEEGIQGADKDSGQGPRSADSAAFSTSAKEAARKSKPSTGTTDSKDLSPKEQEEIEKLKKRDAEVRAHERAHIAAGGQYVRGGATYKLKMGPDGHEYADGGEVSIDRNPVRGDPDATIRKFQTIKRAALAPANPSAQDYSVAASAEAAAVQAYQEKLKNLLKKVGSGSESQTPSKGSNLDMVA